MLTLRERIEATVERFQNSTGTAITRKVLEEAASVLQADLDYIECYGCTDPTAHTPTDLGQA